ncbi:MAG: methyl-accepting chemotaxis protein [Pseudomonadota bacterium]
MALVKKSALGTRAKVAPSEEGAPPAIATHPAKRSPARRPSAERTVTVVERIDQATEELASGLAEASSASTELQHSMTRIASGAEEAAGAAQESLGSVGALGKAFESARERAAASQRRAEAVQTAFAEASAQIELSVAAIELNARRQLSTVDAIGSLEAAAASIGDIGQTVADISDQTSLLALNATIEAARAGDNGSGFAVVADEVRALAVGSETSADDIQTLAESIAAEIRLIAERVRSAAASADAEAKAGREVVGQLDHARAELALVAAGAQDILSASTEMDIAAREAERGAEQVASAAEEQSAAAAEAQQAIEQQSISLDQSQQTSESLGHLTQQLRGTGDKISAAQEVAAAAEELSATVQELSGASGQILVAIEQIGRGAEIQSAATIEANSAMGQIETAAALAQARAGTSAERLTALVTKVTVSRETVEALAAGVDGSVGETREVLGLLVKLGDTGRRIEKITDALALIAVQTNMLAVSGSVEATRAGEAGSGFSTVAADIRKLSRESALNSERAKDTVRAIQDQMAAVRRDLDQIVGAAEGEVVRARAMIDRFNQIAVDLDESQADSLGVAQDVDAILRSVREVKSGTDQIATAAELAADAAREASSAARQQSQGAEMLAAAIEEIASLAGALVTSAA